MPPDAPAPARDRASASSADVSPAHGERRDGKTKRSSATKKKASARRPRRDGRDAKHDPWARVEDLAGTKHYDVLGVPRDADARAIKRAYREMARTSHPDKGGSDAAFAAVRAAFETLGHPARRAAYDALASEHEYRYIPGVTPRARGGEDAMLDDLERLGLSLDPGSQLVVLCEVCGRPSNKTCFACGIKFCDFCTRKLHWRGGVGLHYPVTNKPGHLRRSLAEKELEKKIEEDARRRLTSDPNYRHDAELAEIRRFKERVAEISRSVGDAFGSRATLTRTFDRRLARYYMWAQTARKVHVAVYVPTGYGDKDLRIEIVPDGGASGGGFGDFGAFSDFAGADASGGIVLVQPEDSPPVVERALAGLIDASAPVETLRSRDGRRCALSLTKARPGETWTRLFQGDPDFARSLRQPYVTHETNEEVTVTFDALPFWVRKDDVRVDVTHAGVRVRCESAGLENLERTFWRGDDAEAGDGDASAEDASADASASSGGGVLSGGELDANASSVGEEKKKKQARAVHASRDRGVVPLTGRDAKNGGRRRVRRRRVARARDRQARPEFAGVAVQEGRRAGQQAGQARVEPQPKLGRAAVPGGPGRFLPRGRPHRPGVFRNRRGAAAGEALGRGRRGRSRGGARAGGAVRERARRAGASGRDGRGGGRGRPRGRPRGRRRGVMGALGRARVERNPRRVAT